MPGTHASVRAIVIALVSLAASVAPAADEARVEEGIRERLQALGYAETIGPVDAYGDKSGVTIYDRNRASPGINVYCSEARDQVLFLDMQGKPVETVDLPHDGSPGNECLPVRYGPGALVVLNSPSLSLIGARSGVRWGRVGLYHHDVAVGPGGELYGFESRARALHHRGQEIEVFNHVITVLDPAGQPVREIDLFDLFGDQIPRPRLDRLAGVAGGTLKPKPGQLEKWKDAFHPNSIEFVSTPPAGLEDADLLISLRNLDRIAFIDSERGKVLWSWGGRRVLDRQHHPTQLPYGNILLFDNGFWRRWSRVIEVDPLSEQIVWEYRAPGFFSAGRGASEPLPNGNVLITESSKGRVFEVTRGGDVVWEFLNPIFDGETGERATIYRMFRMSVGEWDARRRAPPG